jgi:hypothetical protein
MPTTINPAVFRILLHPFFQGFVCKFGREGRVLEGGK